MFFFLSVLKNKNDWLNFPEIEEQTRQSIFSPNYFPTLWFHDTITKIVHIFSFDNVYILSKTSFFF